MKITLLLIVLIVLLLNKNTLAKKCKIGKKTTEEQCTNKIANKGCNLVWLGDPCCKKENEDGECVKFYGDGGCRKTTGKKRCNVNCQTNCNKISGCFWENNKCKKDDGKGSAKDVMLFPSFSMQKANKGIEGFNQHCEESKPTMDKPKNDNYYCDGMAYALMCSSEQGMTQIQNLLNVKDSAKVYGTQDVMISTWSDLEATSGELTSTYYDAGLRIKKGSGGSYTNKFWSGCMAEGQASENTCNDWTSAAKGVKATWGSLKATDAGVVKEAGTTPCSNKRQLVCACARGVIPETE